MVTQLARLGLVAGIGIVLGGTGCAAFLSSPQSGSKIRQSVPKAPPPLRAEKKPGKVPSGHFWVAGYWDYDRGSQTYRWREGHMKAQRPGRRYMQARYTNKDGKWTFVLPHWRRAKRRQASPTSPAPQPGGSAAGAGATVR